MRCFAIALGFSEDYFVQAIDASASDTLNQLRFLHYFPSENHISENGAATFGAGTHTDFGCLTLLFQQEGGDGLEICPGRESHTSGALGDTFFPIPAKTGPIVVNLGDMLSNPDLSITHDLVVLMLLKCLGPMTVSRRPSTESAPRKADRLIVTRSHTLIKGEKTFCSKDP